MSDKEFQEMVDKANKWDALGRQIDACYGKEDEHGQWIEFDDEENEDMGNDLVKIGEIAAHAFGWI